MNKILSMFIGILIGCIATIGIINATGNTIVNEDKYDNAQALQYHNDLLKVYTYYFIDLDSTMTELDSMYNVYDQLPGYYYDVKEAVMQQWHKEKWSWIRK